MKTTPSTIHSRYNGHWDRMVLYAYLRMMGSTQTSAASAVGRARRSVQLWEEDKVRYAQAREEARKRWLSEVTDASRAALLKTIKDGNGLLALQVLERVDEDLAPPKLRHDVNLKGGGLASLLTEARESRNGTHG